MKFLSYKRNEVKKFVKKTDNSGLGVIEYKPNGNVMMVYDEFEKRFKDFEIIEISDIEDITKIDENKLQEKFILLTLYSGITFEKIKEFLKNKDKKKYLNLFNKLKFVIS